MAALEERLFASGLPVAALMEKAALALCRRLRARLHPGPDRGGESLRWAASAGVLVLVGPGHNGGDGLVVARELHLVGIPVRLWSPFQRYRPLTEGHLGHARWLGIPLLESPPDPADGALWVDALFGIGQNRPPAEALQALLEERQRRRPGHLVAVDGPTGLCYDSGRLLGWGGATAALTWSIGLLKRGFLQDRALARVGRLERLELGLPASLLRDLPPHTPCALGAADASALSWPALDPAAAKYGRGRLLVVAGSRRYRGAAALALAGASASGCGSLRAALPQELADALWLQQPQVVLEACLESDSRGELLLEPLAELDLGRLDALLLGPGLGRAEPGNPGREERAWQALAAFAGLLVLDADGLNRLAGCPEGGQEWLRNRQGPTWITPHRGEHDRLFPDLASLEPLEAAAQAAQASGAVVLLKGARSVVAAPDGRRWQLREAAPEAARAGLGDTLAGYLAGRGAMAVAALAGPRSGEALEPMAHLLAHGALLHALAGLRLRTGRGPGAITPQAVAEALAQGVDGRGGSVGDEV